MKERERKREPNIMGKKKEHSLQKFSEKKKLYERQKKERDRKNNMLNYFILSQFIVLSQISLYTLKNRFGSYLQRHFCTKF